MYKNKICMKKINLMHFLKDKLRIQRNLNNKILFENKNGWPKKMNISK